MKLHSDLKQQTRRSEPTTALINIVFLMLIFFLVASQIAPPMDDNLKLLNTTDLDPQSPPDAMVILPDGYMRYRGAAVSPAQYVTITQEEKGTIEQVRLVPDRSLPAVKMIEISNELRKNGVGKILLVTERSPLVSPQ